MDLEFNRCDYIQVEGTSRGAVKIQPRSSEGCQKVVVGSQSGVVHAFGVSRGRIETVFKTLPGKGVSCIQLGGPVGSIQDKIFVAAGNEITGYTRKGKQFLKFDTNLTDTIRCMSVCGNDLAVCGEYVYSHYFECQDKNYYLSSGRINDMIMLPVDKLRALVPVLACQDRLLRVLKDSQCQMEIEVSGPATALCLHQGDGGATGKDVVYGTSDGKIGLLSIDKSPQAPVWEIENLNGGGSITCLGSYDITGDGALDLLVGRNDGQVEIYSFSDLGEPMLRFTYNCGESVTSVQGGAIGNAHYEEVLVTTYSGWIFGLSAEHSEKRLDPNYLLISPESAQKIFKLKAEVEQLEQKVARERETYQLRTYSDKGSVSAVPFFALDDSFVLHHQDASYVLAIQLQTAIDTVVLQSNVPVDILDSSKNSAVVSYTTCDPQSSGNYLLVTFRCQANTSRLEVKVRTIEGQQGVLRAYVTALLQPKCCRRREYQIRPLSLHRRAHSLLEDDRPMNVLTLRGSFSVAEMHAWLVLSLPEAAEKPPVADSPTLRFVSTFLGTLLVCSYRRGEATFKSDNISTISILRDFLAKQATKKTIRLDITCDFNNESIAHALRMIHPKLEHQLVLAKKIQLVEALKDLKVYEGNADCLAPEYQDILERSDDLEMEFKKQPCHLERLYGMITDLYIDVYKFKGTNVKSKVPALLQVLDHYDFSSLVAFFNNNA
ncbi:Bardet-Biedl syndrome 7 protein homolog [Rhipicephalus sanguineus]|uniref:Bardet-Biedl syndrome 7 protein homolog n=1 Tax=Rhipicephalus sanguineus TaxID=34632 RepID=UPI0020C24831|nr:Bardet-Biedl syndrome 7 protein homolog [Rhipicephalus sanguineus]